MPSLTSTEKAMDDYQRPVNTGHSEGKWNYMMSTHMSMWKNQAGFTTEISCATAATAAAISMISIKISEEKVTVFMNGVEVTMDIKDPSW